MSHPLTAKWLPLRWFFYVVKTINLQKFFRTLFCEYLHLRVYFRSGAANRVKMELQEERGDERKSVRRPIDPFQYNQWRHYGSKERSET